MNKNKMKRLQRKNMKKEVKERSVEKVERIETKRNISNRSVAIILICMMVLNIGIFTMITVSAQESRDTLIDHCIDNGYKGLYTKGGDQIVKDRVLYGENIGKTISCETEQGERVKLPYSDQGKPER